MLGPASGRFTSRDPLGTWGDALSLGNGYAFAGSNPHASVDPSGMIGVPISALSELAMRAWLEEHGGSSDVTLRRIAHDHRDYNERWPHAVPEERVAESLPPESGGGGVAARYGALKAGVVGRSEAAGAEAGARVAAYFVRTSADLREASLDEMSGGSLDVAEAQSPRASQLGTAIGGDLAREGTELGWSAGEEVAGGKVLRAAGGLTGMMWRRGAARGGAVSSQWGRNRLLKELHDQGFVLDRPTRSGGGLLYRNAETGAEIRIMPKPSQRFRNDPPAKHASEYYYRQRTGTDQPWGPHTSIPDKN